MQTNLFINGALVPGGGEALPVLDPATGSEIVAVNEATPGQVDAAVAAPHQLVVGQVGLQGADGTDVTAGGERSPLAAPHDRTYLRSGSQLAEDLEELRVHLVVERVVLLVVVVGDGRDCAVDLESYLPCHAGGR